MVVTCLTLKVYQNSASYDVDTLSSSCWRFFRKLREVSKGLGMPICEPLTNGSSQIGQRLEEEPGEDKEKKEKEEEEQAVSEDLMMVVFDDAHTLAEAQTQRQ